MAGLDLDLSATKAALISSSTKRRIAALHVLEERLTKKGGIPLMRGIREHKLTRTFCRDRSNPFPTPFTTHLQHIPILPRSGFTKSYCTMHTNHLQLWRLS